MKIAGNCYVDGNRVIVEALRPVILANGFYDVELKPVAGKKTLKQNAYLWQLITEICIKENGSAKDKFDTYVNLLQMSNAKYETVMIKEDAYQDFRKKWPDCKIIHKDIVNHVPWLTIEAFYGSSIFNKLEMKQLIDTTLMYASEIGVDTDYYEEVLKNDE